MNLITRANAISSQMVSLILIIVGSTLAVVAFIKPADVGSKGQMFTFASGIITGAFALLRGDSTKTQTTETSPGLATRQTVETPQTPNA